MQLGRFIEGEPRERSKSKGEALKNKNKSSAQSIVSHSIFVPTLCIWGAVVLGGAILVLPTSAILRISMVTGLGAIGGYAQIVLAAIASVLGGLAASFLASAFRKRALKSDLEDVDAAALEAQPGQPINPAIDLGSENLDAPIEHIPFGDETKNEFEDLPESLFEDWLSEEDEPCVEPSLNELAERNTERETPQEADAQAQDDNRPDFTPSDAVGVETSAEHDKKGDAQAAIHPLNPAELPAKSALERLRQRPPEELSLVEMVERFAGALHERQDKENERLPNSTPARDPALVDALKALALFTQTDRDTNAPEMSDTPPLTDELSRTERELRDALSKLQNLRGAA